MINFNFAIKLPSCKLLGGRRMKSKWTIYTSIHLFEYCVYSWGNHMWNHIHGYTDEKLMRDLFWKYLNFGHTSFDTYGN